VESVQDDRITPAKQSQFYCYGSTTATGDSDLINVRIALRLQTQVGHLAISHGLGQ
jgi:hypothetical protein